MPSLFQIPIQCSTVERAYKLDQAEIGKIRLHHGGEVRQVGELSDSRSPWIHDDLSSPC